MCVFLNIHLGGIECVFVCVCMCERARMFWNASVRGLGYVCVYLCMCFCVHVYMCVYVDLCACERMFWNVPMWGHRMYVCASMHVFLCICACRYVSMCVRVFLFWNAPVWEHKICVCVCVCACTFMCICVHVYLHVLRRTCVGTEICLDRRERTGKQSCCRAAFLAHHSSSVPRPKSKWIYRDWVVTRNINDSVISFEAPPLSACLGTRLSLNDSL